MNLPDLIRPNDRILFQGDSITNAFRKPEELCNAYQLGAGYALMVASQLLAARPDDHLSIDNRGVSGEGIGGLQKRWQADCLDLRPDLLSILVGINDATPVGENTSAVLRTYEATYREVLQVTTTALPGVRLVLCEPFVLDVGKVMSERDGVRERASIVRQLADDFGARVVPLEQLFDDAVKRAPADYWSYDGIHPNAQGHWLIAQAWLQVVTGRG